MTTSHPKLIQGGMGVAVSDWRLAKSVSVQGQLGVVSGTAMDVVLARRLQLGDLDGSARRALKAFPFPSIAEAIIDKYYIPGGKAESEPFKSVSMLSENPSRHQTDLLVAGNFVEVYLAKEGHDGVVGVNLLEKIQLPTLPSLYGAMLAGVDYVLMGAGIPRLIPGILDSLSAGDAVELPLVVENADPDVTYVTRFDPNDFCENQTPILTRPFFLAIVSSPTLATMLAKKSNGRVDGFVVENHFAGGHNAAPRGPLQIDEHGEPIYGRRDEVNLSTFKKLGFPFWLAGSFGTHDQFLEAIHHGAVGVQVGTPFAFCEESGLATEIKEEAIQLSKEGRAEVFTDPLASPTGFPFKLLQLEGSLSEQECYEDRKRVCDLGYLRHAYKKDDGSVGWRCPGENVEQYVKKGGKKEETVGRKCICNGLLSNVGHGQTRKNQGLEKILVTCGKEVSEIHRFLPSDMARSYRSENVIDQILYGFPQVESLPLCMA